MKILLLIALTTIIVSSTVHSSVITARDGVINCDELICPTGSTSCTVSENTFGDLSSYKRIRMCADEQGVPTVSRTEVIKNPRPGTVINVVSQYGGSGNNRKLSAAEEKQLREQIENIQKGADQMAKQAADQARDTANYWNNWSSDFTAQMQKRFHPGFLFGN